MNITINGTPRQLASAQNLAEVVESFCKQSKHVISELNGTIVRSDKWTKTTIKDGDTLELVTFVGGG